jgi:hypothetical protein
MSIEAGHVNLSDALSISFIDDVNYIPTLTAQAFGEFNFYDNWYSSFNGIIFSLLQDETSMSSRYTCETDRYSEHSYYRDNN